MSQTKTGSKTNRAFRTISEAGDELGLQPHVLRFWESKFPQIKPIKRGGGRRFYRPEDIEFLRGVKILLHDEKHSIKDVQKLIQKKGTSRISELGRSVEKASKERSVADTDLLPERIKAGDITGSSKAKTARKVKAVKPAKVPEPVAQVPDAPKPIEAPEISTAPVANKPAPKNSGITSSYWPVAEVDMEALENAMSRLQALKSKWVSFREDNEES